MEEKIVLGRVCFVEGAMESDWYEDILAIHTGANNDSYGQYMDLYLDSDEIIRYYPNIDNGKSKYFFIGTRGVGLPPEEICEMNNVRNVELLNLTSKQPQNLCDKVLGEAKLGLCESEVDSVNDFKNCLEKMESEEATKDWYESRIKDLKAELAMTRMLLKMTTEKLVSSGIVAG